jgi:hypothetical protein
LPQLHSATPPRRKRHQYTTVAARIVVQGFRLEKKMARPFQRRLQEAERCTTVPPPSSIDSIPTYRVELSLKRSAKSQRASVVVRQLLSYTPPS